MRFLLSETGTPALENPASKERLSVYGFAAKVEIGLILDFQVKWKFVVSILQTKHHEQGMKYSNNSFVNMRFEKYKI